MSDVSPTQEVTVPQYLLTIYEDESRYATMPPEEMGRMMAGYRAFGQAVEEAGAFRAGQALKPTGTATTVRVRDGERMLTDGPFAETREQLGGYYVLECDTQEEAAEWAARIPGAESGCVEVREFQIFDDAPDAGAEARAEAAR